MRNLELPILGDLDDQHSHNAIDRPALLRRGLRLEYLGIGWNLVKVLWLSQSDWLPAASP